MNEKIIIRSATEEMRKQAKEAFSKKRTTLDYARKYVEEGSSVIPLQERSKEPAISSWKTFQSRKPTIKELNGWFGKGSKLNIGIVTGEISGILVANINSEEGHRFADEHDFQLHH